MGNSIASLTTDLQTFGQLLLSETRAKLVVARLASKGNPAGAQIIGRTVVIPDLDIVGEADVRDINGAVTASDLVSTSRAMTIQQLVKSIRVDNLEVLFSNVDLMQRAASRLAYKVAKKYDSIVCGLWSKCPYEVGEVDGSAAFNATDKHTVLADAYKVLVDNEADTDGLVAVFGTAEALAFRKLENLWSVDKAGSAQVLRTAQLGSILGFDLYESQQIVSAATSTAAEANSPGAVVGVNAKGALTLSMNGLGTGTLKKGTSFSIAGFSKRYIVTADAAITINAATPAIYPALEAATAGAEVITFIEHSASSSQNLAFHPEAIRTLSVAPSDFRAGGGVVSTTVSDPQTGLSIRVSYEAKAVGGANEAMSEFLTADAIVAAEAVRPDWIVRITGD